MVAMVFKGDEDAYFSWLTTHPKGYILDTLSVPSNKHLILHSAKCRTIGKPPNAALSPLPDEDRSIKICAEDVQGLSDWINEQGLEDLSKQCELCNPRGKPTHRRFTWARDELILALDLYFTSPAARSNVRHPGIVELSELLQELPIHPVELRPPNFRNPNGVAMKLGNFLVYDPRYTGTGLQQGAQMEQAIWNELSGDLPRLRETASAIREHYPILKSAGIQHIIEDDGVEEGGIVLALHKLYERDKSIIKKKKKDVFHKYMALRCEVCDFDFAEVYGELGSLFAECHHTKPVAKMKAGEKTKQSDLSIVCANCHRMLHRDRDLLSVDGLKNLLAKVRASNAIKNTFK